MPKLPVVSGRDCITLRRDNPASRVTVPNHKTLKPGLLRRIIKDAGLTTDEFTDLL